jgi:hypothetical protein
VRGAWCLRQPGIWITTDSRHSPMTCSGACRQNGRRRPSQRAMPAATGASSGISNSYISFWAFPGWCSATPIITRPLCFRRRSAVACPPACSRRSARSGAWCMRSTRLSMATATGGFSAFMPAPVKPRRPNSCPRYAMRSSVSRMD